MLARTSDMPSAFSDALVRASDTMSDPRIRRPARAFHALMSDVRERYFENGPSIVQFLQIG
jgi:hypothetical protein